MSKRANLGLPAPLPPLPSPEARASNTLSICLQNGCPLRVLFRKRFHDCGGKKKGVETLPCLDFFCFRGRNFLLGWISNFSFAIFQRGTRVSASSPSSSFSHRAPFLRDASWNKGAGFWGCVWLMTLDKGEQKGGQGPHRM